MTARPTWAGYCTGCHRDGLEVGPRRDHGERVLCERCAALPYRVAPGDENHRLDQLEALAERQGHLPAPSSRANGAPPNWLDGAPMDPLAVAAEPLPAVPGFPYAHRGASVVIVGPTGGGRSSLAQAGGYDAARAGLRVAYLGSEVSKEEFDARAGDLAERRGDTIDDELRTDCARVRYFDLASRLVQAWEHPAEWTAGVTARFDIVILDPLSSVAAALDLDFDQRNADYVKFHDQLVQPLVNAGLLVVMPDNIGHAIEAKARAKGVSAKNDRADLTFNCTRQAQPTGLIVTAQKVRSIRAPFEHGASWVFDRATQRIVGRDRDEATAPTFRPTVLMERVSRALEETPGLSKSAIRRGVKGGNDTVDLALETLIAEGYVEVRQEGQAHLHHVVRPYRKDDDNGHPAPLPQPCPNPARAWVEATLPPCPSLQGHGAGGTGDEGTPNPAPCPDDTAGAVDDAECACARPLPTPDEDGELYCAACGRPGRMS